MPESNNIALKKLSEDLGMDLFGVADIHKVKDEFSLSPRILAQMERAVCLGVRRSRSSRRRLQRLALRVCR